MRLFPNLGLRVPGPGETLAGRDEPMTVPARHDVLGTPLQPPFPEGLERAVVGLGCFWGAERVFWQAPGVYTTAVGYAGGQTPNPTYKEVCSGRTGHTEAVLVVFDPAVTSYDEILRLFWEGHDPTQGMRQGNDVGTQYRSAILYDDEAQRAAAEASRDAYQDVLTRAGFGRITTEIAPAGPFYYAEDVSPAVPRQEPGRLLRARRHRRRLPRRADRSAEPLERRSGLAAELARSREPIAASCARASPTICGSGRWQGRARSRRRRRRPAERRRGAASRRPSPSDGSGCRARDGRPRSPRASPSCASAAAACSGAGPASGFEPTSRPQELVRSSSSPSRASASHAWTRAVSSAVGSGARRRSGSIASRAPFAPSTRAAAACTIPMSQPSSSISSDGVRVPARSPPAGHARRGRRPPREERPPAAAG